MHINKEDHPELWAAKLKRFKRKVAQIVDESREAHRLLDLELEEEAREAQRKLELEAEKKKPVLRVVK